MSSARESVRGGTLKKATVTQWLSERQRQERRPRLGQSQWGFHGPVTNASIFWK